MTTRKILIDLTEPLPLALLADPVDGAIVLSLFCDARDDAANPADPRGWWGDALSDSKHPGDRWGGRLWTLARRAKHTTETLRQAEDLAREALRWLLDDNEATTLSVQASAAPNETLLLAIAIDGQRIDLEIRQ